MGHIAVASIVATVGMLGLTACQQEPKRPATTSDSSAHRDGSKASDAPETAAPGRAETPKGGTASGDTGGFSGWTPQKQLATATDDCPGPFDYPPGTPSSLTDWQQKPQACVRQFIPPVSNPGPTWQEYQAVNTSYTCGIAATDPKATYVTGQDWSYDKPDGPAPFGACTAPGSGSTCPDMSSKAQGCCCPVGASGQAGSCFTLPRFNWIIGVCQGSTCNGAYSETPALQPYKNIGTQLVINYVATYNFDTSDSTWKIAKDASFNTDGSRPAYDAIKAHGGMSAADAWLSPSPGGSVQWGAGFSPIGAEGAGPLATTASTPGLEGTPGAAMFVLSTQRSYNFAFYMVNQVTIDRGGGSPLCDNWDNCWATGNGGEIDFLESPFSAASGGVDDYRRLYLNNINQFGRSFPAQINAEPGNAHANGGWGSDWETSAMMLGSDPMDTSDEPLVYVAIVDSVGSWVYRFPGSSVATQWPGLGQTTAAATLQAAPSQPQSGQPCTDTTASCATFIPNCQGRTWGGPAQFGQPDGAANQGCGINGTQGFCQNWFQLLSNTGQWQWTDQGGWGSSATDPLYIGVQGPKGPDTCPDGSQGDKTWCIEQPWNRMMAPFECQTPYGSSCARTSTAHKG